MSDNQGPTKQTFDNTSVQNIQARSTTEKTTKENSTQETTEEINTESLEHLLNQLSEEPTNSLKAVGYLY